MLDKSVKILLYMSQTPKKTYISKYKKRISFFKIRRIWYFVCKKLYYQDQTFNQDCIKFLFFNKGNLVHCKTIIIQQLITYKSNCLSFKCLKK
jgi:hypothetical protein